MSKTVENVDQVKELVPKNRIITICEAAGILGILIGSENSERQSESALDCHKIRAPPVVSGAEGDRLCPRQRELL